MDRNAWKNRCSDFLRLVCTNWGLPAAKQAEPRTESSADHTTKNDGSEDRRKEDFEVLELEWEAASQRFGLIVDCQPLQQIMCGHIPLLNENYHPLLTRALNSIVGVVRHGWLPSTGRSDPIIWTRRENYYLADYLCNWTMDVKKTSWREEKQRGPNASSLLLMVGLARNALQVPGFWAHLWMLTASCSLHQPFLLAFFLKLLSTPS